MTQIQPITSNNSSTLTNNNNNTTAVQVALRVRPLTQQDRSQPRFSHSTNSDVLKTYDNSIAIVPHQKSFQFDYVFDADSTQDQVFKSVASNFVDRFIDGYNVTILAYGQTSSGKTYTMGTAIDDHLGSNPEQEGIIPRAMSALFQRLEDIKKESCTDLKSSSSIKDNNKRAPSVLSTFPPTSGLRVPRRTQSTVKLRPVSMIAPPRRGSNTSAIPNSATSNIPVNDKATRYTVHVSFIEIYNEELIDLLNPAPPHERTPVTIREDTKGHIIWTGLKEVPVGNTEDVLRYLQMGTENRATGSTDMNAKSSRSHAIFSVTLKQEKWIPSSITKPSTTKPSTLNHRQSTLNVKALIGQMEKQNRSITPPEEEDGEWMVVNSKFHFVDLAGSERLKRTAAQGDRRKEGININAGLLALGNVISALSDPSKKSTHVPYRDSKLTRLLQDSLGGNSTTLMIACVSPAEINLTETINTIKYAYRARNIRNKSERNEMEEWMTSDNLDHLRQIIQKLKAEIKSLKSHRGTPSPTSGGSPKSHITTFNHGIVSPSSSSLSDGEVHPSTCPSRSASTNITAPDTSISTELFDSHHPNDVAVMVSDLKRQIEELQNEVTVTRERNQHVEKELRQKQSADTNGAAFQHLVEPVIEEYEKSISGLESQLAMARAALNHSDQALADKQAKIDEYEAIQENELRALEELKSRLASALDREHSNEGYCLELEAQLEKSVRDGLKDQQILSELREKIMKFKAMDDHTEQYISDLEARLSTAENERIELTQKLARLSKTDNVDNNETKEDAPANEITNPLFLEHSAEKESLLKELSQCKIQCQELEQELKKLKEQEQTKAVAIASTVGLDQSTQSEKYVDEESSLKIAQLLTEKETQLIQLESKIEELEQAKTEFNQLRDTHIQETQRLENDITALKEQCSAYQIQLAEQELKSKNLQDTIDTLTKSSDDHTTQLEQAQKSYAELQLLIQEQEKSAQSTLQQRLQEIEKFNVDMDSLRLVEEKQDAIIQGLEIKLEEMDHLICSLRAQLEERNNTIELLEADNLKKTEIAADMQKQLEGILKDVCGMNIEKRQLEQVMHFMEGTLRLQDAKSDKTMETLEDIKHHYKAREEEIEEKRRTVNLLSAEKEQLSHSLEQVSQRASQGDAVVKDLEEKLDEARHSLTERDSLVNELRKEQSQSRFELQRVQALESRVQELDREIEIQQKAKLEKQEELNRLEHAIQKQLVQNEGLIKTIDQLQTSLKEERALASSQDTTGMIAELEKKLISTQQAKKREDDVWKAQMEKLQEELYMSRKENNDFRKNIEMLEISLNEVKQELHQQQQILKEKESLNMHANLSMKRPSLIDDALLTSTDDETHRFSTESSQQELLEKILQLEEDNAQLLRHNDNLESQLVLQRGQLTLETKNLELELMKLTAANDRLEKEMEQVIPRSNNSVLASHNRDSMQFTSPPQTPRVSSPPLPTASNSTGSIIHYKLQRDISSSSIAKLSKSGSYRSVSTILQDNGMTAADEEAYKRLSTTSMKSDIANNARPSPTLKNSSRSVISSNNLPPPTAPPSNPLPPIPTPLPPLPNSPNPPSISGSSVVGSPPNSPSMQPVNTSSLDSLKRQDSTTSASFSEIMNATTSTNFTAEQYDKLIRSLQRKALFAENDVKAHQEVISKLESQLSRSESSVREAKKQLDVLSKEKQAYNLEIQNLRTQVTQIQSQQKNTTDESINERKELEQKLEEQKLLKEKAEKARRILENRMDELMTKKSKFMCF